MTRVLVDHSRPRYQECPWYVRLWRRRFYALIPWYYLQELHAHAHDPNFVPLRVRWGLAVAEVHLKMNWWYTLDECMEALGD